MVVTACDQLLSLQLYFQTLCCPPYDKGLQLLGVAAI